MESAPDSGAPTRDPWRVKYDGRCARCGLALVRGTPAIWDRATRTIHCIECPPEAQVEESEGLEHVVDAGVAGRSARTEHDRREGRRQTAITERWGTGLVAKVVRAVSEEPQSTRAWAIGAAGEEKLAAVLEAVPGLRMLHDRRVPGTRGNIDHIVVAPAGVFVVDAKNHRGSLEVRDRAGLFRTDLRLMVGGRDHSALADGMSWQVEAVSGALTRAQVDPMPPVVPVLCFLNVEWPLFHPPESFRGVRLEGPRSIKRLLTREQLLADTQADRLIGTLAEALPAK